MSSMLKFNEFKSLNENLAKKKWAELEARIRSEVPEIGGETWKGTSTWSQAMAENPGGALGRLVGAVGVGISKLGQAIFGAIGSKFAKGAKDEEEAFSRWGESIQSSGKNKRKDYEDFYRNSLVSGRRTFGSEFDIENPRTSDQRKYKDYIRRSRQYFDID